MREVAIQGLDVENSKSLVDIGRSHSCSSRMSHEPGGLLEGIRSKDDVQQPECAAAACDAPGEYDTQHHLLVPTRLGR